MAAPVPASPMGILELFSMFHLTEMFCLQLCHRIVLGVSIFLLDIKVQAAYYYHTGSSLLDQELE
jgi:hypothetical protein